ncbi:hypothetical protein [Butyrivibrio sp. INlla14]|nr:hypothetical protein [Butyrivibrio sp. INlla14]
MESESDENRADGYEVVSGPRTTGDGYYKHRARKSLPMKSVVG